MDNEAGGFRTPDEVATAETPKDQNQYPQSATPGSTPTPKSSGGWRQKLAQHWPPTRRQWFIIGGLVILLIAAGCAFVLSHRPAKPVVTSQVKRIAKPVAPKTVASNLSGLQVDPSINQRPVTGVMIENSLDSRPQSGLIQASVIFEAIAEGGITRFLALFQDNAPDDIGPIRSARPYYVQWAMGFDAGYAHVGGSPEALANIKTWGAKDLDQFANGGSYHRISSRPAPHNVYTSLAALNQLQAAKGYTTSNYTGFPRKKVTPSKQPNATKIDLALSGRLYNVHYDYAAGTNSYNRSEGGAAHTDISGVPISPTVVIALVVPYGIHSDGHHSEYATIGSGSAYIFQDGTAVIGQWTKTSEKSQITFTDAAGKPLLLNPGQAWLTAVGGTNNISYAL
ncbi:MAG: DUF3048 domain-containing protein [Patescibacteria group bacterium]